MIDVYHLRFQFVRMVFLVIARSTILGFVCFGGSSAEDKVRAVPERGVNARSHL